MSEITELAQQVADLTTSTTELTDTVVGQMDRLSAEADLANTKAEEARASELSAEASVAEANDSAAKAKISEDNAAAITTGGTATLVAEAGKIPLADANGKIDSDWLKSEIRYSKIDNPLTHIFKKNKLVDTLDGELTWTRASNATYVDRNGVLQYAGIDEPRQEKDGWLIEGTSTNSLPYSNGTFTSFSGFTVNYAAALSPDKTLNAIEIVEDSSTVEHFVQRNKTGVTTQETFSVFVKRGVGNRAVRMRNGGTFRADFDFDSESFTAPNLDTLSFNSSKLADGWFRLSMTSTEAKASVNSWRVQLIDNGISNYQGDGVSSVYVAFMQVESLPFASSYIPTEDSPVTRLGDAVSIPAEGNFTDDFSIALNTRMLGETGLNKFPFFMDASNQHFVTFTNNGQVASNYKGGAYTAISPALGNVGVNTFVATTFNKESLGMTVGTSTELTTVVTGYSGEYMERPINLFFGKGQGAYAYCHLQDFRIYDFALNEQEIKFLAGE